MVLGSLAVLVRWLRNCFAGERSVLVLDIIPLLRLWLLLLTRMSSAQFRTAVSNGRGTDILGGMGRRASASARDLVLGRILGFT